MKKLICLLCLLPLSLGYAEQFNANTQWHGFVSQGIIQNTHSNYISDDQGISTKLTELGINGSMRLSDSFRVAGQLVYLNGGNRYSEGARLDYLLLEWNAYNSKLWRTNFYFGRYKNNHWLYSDTRDIPFARPSIILPQSIYLDSFRDIAMGSDGVAIRSNFSDDHWGDIDINASYGSSDIDQKQMQVLLSKYATGSGEQLFDAQASLYWRPPFSAWRFGMSLLNSDFKYNKTKAIDQFFDGKFSFQFYTLNALYEGERWEWSSEIYHQRFVTSGFYYPGAMQVRFGQGAYIQSRYGFSNNLKLLARIEKFYLDKNDKNGARLEANSGGFIPRYFGFQNDITLGFSYDIKRNLRVQFEQHWVQGTGRLNPIVLPNPAINNHKYWQLTALQLMYWF